jgi:hypothetical protein
MWKWLELDFYPDARRAQVHPPTFFMVTHGWPNGFCTGADRHCLFAAEQRRDESDDLIIHLFRRAGESVLPVLPYLLQAMFVRMQTAAFLQVDHPIRL